MIEYRKAITLNGTWKFKTDPEGQGDFQEPGPSKESWQRPCKFFDPEYDDCDWEQIAVPACWLKSLPKKQGTITSA